MPNTTLQRTPAIKEKPPQHPNTRVLARVLSCLAIAALAALVLQESSYPSRLAINSPGRKPDAQLGREIYIAEGCIHCHSQYARPKTRDEIQWGPSAKPAQVLSQQPPLIGNRRQGPDLMNVGNRRSPEWQRVHLMNPRALMPGSRMPAYAHLFAKGDLRGEALLAYLSSLGAGTADERAQQIMHWTPSSRARPLTKSADVLFQANCANCHGERGTGDGHLADQFGGRTKCTLLKNFTLPSQSPNEPEIIKLARVIKFGIPGTQMPGYESLTDSDVLGLAQYIANSQLKGSTE